MESNRDAPIYRIPTAVGAGSNVKPTVDQYVKYHREKETEQGSRTQGYAEVKIFLLFFKLKELI